MMKVQGKTCTLEGFLYYFNTNIKTVQNTNSEICFSGTYGFGLSF